MNIFLVTLVIFVLVYFLLNWFAKTSSKKISQGITSVTIIRCDSPVSGNTSTCALDL